jgi:transposase-like protein
LSSVSIISIKQILLEEHRAWHKRDICMSRYCFFRLDCICVNLRYNEGRCARFEPSWVLEGKKELMAFAGGHRENAEPWFEALRDFNEGGMASPKLCIGRGALSFANMG